MTYSSGVQMDSDQAVFEEQRGGGEGGDARRGASKRGREEEEEEGGLGPLRVQERRDPLSRRQGRGVGK